MNISVKNDNFYAFTFEVLKNYHFGLNAYFFFLYLASFILEPDPDHPGRETGHFY